MSAEETSSSQRMYAQLIAKACADPDLKARLVAEPAAVLAEHGIKVAAGITIRVVEDSAAVRHLVLPANPDDLTDEQLEGVGGGRLVFA